MQIAGLQGSQDPGEGGTPWLSAGGAHVLILGLKFQVREIIWDLKIWTRKCAFWGLEIQGSWDYLGSDISMSS